MRATLEDPLSRRELTLLLLSIYGAAGHSIDSCLAAVARAGYHISEYAPARDRPESRAVSPEPVRARPMLPPKPGGCWSRSGRRAARD